MCTAAALFLLAASAPVTWARDAQICITSAVNLPASDEWPKKPAPEAWVKVEIGGRQLCKTSPIENSVTPRWEHCCHVDGDHQHSWYWFSVFDADYSGLEGDYLGSAGLPASSSAGVYELELTGAEKVSQHGKPVLTVEVPLAPPPPPPPRGGVVAIEVDEVDRIVVDSAKDAEAKKFLCIMSAKGLVETDFFPRMGVFKRPDTWVRLTSRNSKEGVFTEAEMDALSMTKDSEDLLQANPNLPSPTEEAQPPADRLECATPIVNNDRAPEWSHCCDVTAAAHKYLLLEVYDEDSAFVVNDYIGSAVLAADTAEGQYELELAGGYNEGSINVLYVTSANPPVMNVGANCWDTCGQSAGLCSAYCGSLGACCRAGKPAAGCPVEGGDPFWHSCRAADLSTLSLLAEPAAAPGAPWVDSTAAAALGAAAVLALAAAAIKKRIGARTAGDHAPTDTASML